jgi:hypothetical protein
MGKCVLFAFLCLFSLLLAHYGFSQARQKRAESRANQKMVSPPPVKPVAIDTVTAEAVKTYVPPKSVTDTSKVAGPRIVSIKIERNKDSFSDEGTVIMTDNVIRITIVNTKEFLSQRPSDHTDLILYANGIPLTGMKTSYFTTLSAEELTDPTKKWPDSLDVPFVFKKDSTNRDAWNSLFHLAGVRENRISFNLSMGWSGMFPLKFANRNLRELNVTLVFYHMRVFYILVTLYICFILYFIWVCHTTGLIREPDRVSKEPGPYSLAQTQLAFWTVIVLGGFIYLLLLTGFSDSLNNSILLLLGITGGTTGVASFIDYYKKSSAISKMPEDTPAAAISTRVHVSFLKDILSDGINVSVQRTQTLLWNLVLGIYFIFYVIANKSMPVFDNTLLVLAGVSSVLYLSSKGPENPSPPPAGTAKS